MNNTEKIEPFPHPSCKGANMLMTEKRARKDYEIYLRRAKRAQWNIKDPISFDMYVGFYREGKVMTDILIMGREQK